MYRRRRRNLKSSPVYFKYCHIVTLRILLAASDKTNSDWLKYKGLHSFDEKAYRQVLPVKALLDPSGKVIRICFLVLTYSPVEPLPTQSKERIALFLQYFLQKLQSCSYRGVSHLPLPEHEEQTVLLSKLGFRCLPSERGLMSDPRYLEQRSSPKKNQRKDARQAGTIHVYFSPCQRVNCNVCHPKRIVMKNNEVTRTVYMCLSWSFGILKISAKPAIRCYQH